MAYDDVFQVTGSFGPYQKRLYILQSLPVVFTAVQTCLSVFILFAPDHRYSQLFFKQLELFFNEYTILSQHNSWSLWCSLHDSLRQLMQTFDKKMIGVLVLSLRRYIDIRFVRRMLYSRTGYHSQPLLYFFLSKFVRCHRRKLFTFLSSSPAK